jgi:hypothetical protein
LKNYGVEAFSILGPVYSLIGMELKGFGFNPEWFVGPFKAVDAFPS